MQTILDKVEIVRNYNPRDAFLSNPEEELLRELIFGENVENEIKFPAERFAGSTLKKVNRVAFLHGCRKAYLPSTKMGRIYGIRRATIFEIRKMSPNDIKRSFDTHFSETVEMVLEIESSEYAHKIEKFFNRNIEELLNLNGKRKPITNTIVTEPPLPTGTVIQAEKEYQVNIEFGLNNTDHDIKVMIKTLNNLNLLDDSLKKRINEKIIEQLFEVDFVQNILNKV